MRCLAIYPGLLFRFLCLPKPDVLLVGYIGQLDLIVIWPFARLRGIPVVWDSFLSLFDTVTKDRALYGPTHIVSRLLFALEWLDVLAAHLILVDTETHGRYIARSCAANSSDDQPRRQP